VRRLAAVAVAVAAFLTVAAGCVGDSPTIASVDSHMITKVQLDSVLDLGREQYHGRHIPCPPDGSAEYTLLTQQALAYLTQKDQAAQADAELGL